MQSPILISESSDSPLYSNNKGESEDSDIRIGDAITGYYAMELLNYSIIIYYIPKISSKEEYRWDKYKDNDTIISNINQLTEKIINKVKVM